MNAGRKIGIYGAGGHGREIRWLISSMNATRDAPRVVAYIQDGEHGPKAVNEIPVLSFADFRESHADAQVVIAVGSPEIREKLAMQCSGVEFATLVHPKVEMSESVEMGAGSIIFAGSILTVDIHIGKHVHVNLDCTVSHDVRIGDFTTLAPGVHITGNVHIGKRVYIGTGATIINGTPDQPLVIGDDVVIAAGACVTKPCSSGGLYAGVPAAFKKLRA